MRPISIITANFNSAPTLDKCLASVRHQTVDSEHIFIDGGSTDRSLDVADRHRRVLSRVISEPDKGLYDAMNKGLGLASGDVVGFLNADDFYPTRRVLSRVVAIFDDPSVDACYGDLVYVDRANPERVRRFWRAGAYAPNRFYHGWMPPHPTFFVRLSVYERFGGFNLDLGSSADYELMLRFMLKHSIQSVYIPSILVHMQSGGVSNASLSGRIKANRMDRKAWCVNGLRPYPWTLFMKPMSKIFQWVKKP
jgi:glycosyltransferase